MSCFKVFNFVLCVILLSILLDVVQSRFVYRPDIQREIKQDKVVATWQEAKEHCESLGAILASPIDSAHLSYMRSYIEVNDHTSAYFTGYKAVIHDDDLNYISVEGIFLNELPEEVINMIEKIDPEDGDCLSMDRREIRAVPCWERLPYICYTKVTNITSHEPTEVSSNAPIEGSSSGLEEVTTEPLDVITNEDDFIRRIFIIQEESPTNFPDMPVETTEATIDERISDADEEEDLSLGYSYYDTGSLYKLHNAPLPWSNANATCAHEGGYLAVINNIAELQVLLQLGDIKPQVLWTGLKKIHGDWRSVKGDNVQEIYNRWSTNLADETCGVIIDTGLLDDRYCEYPFPFICEKNVVPIDGEA